MLTIRPAQADDSTVDDAPDPVTVQELDQFVAVLDDAPAGDDPWDDPELVAMLTQLEAELHPHRVARR
jgi:hypothetical protein